MLETPHKSSSYDQGAAGLVTSMTSMQTTDGSCKCLLQPHTTGTLLWTRARSLHGICLLPRYVAKASNTCMDHAQARSIAALMLQNLRLSMKHALILQDKSFLIPRRCAHAAVLPCACALSSINTQQLQAYVLNAHHFASWQLFHHQTRSPPVSHHQCLVLTHLLLRPHQTCQKSFRPEDHHLDLHRSFADHCLLLHLCHLLDCWRWLHHSHPGLQFK